MKRLTFNLMLFVLTGVEGLHAQSHTDMTGKSSPGLVDSSVVYADQYPGSDAFAQANDAMSALTNGGTVILRSSTGTNVATTLKIKSPNISVKCQNSGSCIYNYTGLADAVRVQMEPFVITQAGSIEGLTIVCSKCGSAANGIHAGDVVGLRLVDLHIENFTGAHSACLWTDNVVGWTERGTEEAVHLDNCTKAHRWTNTKNTQRTSSFGHWPLIEERWNLTGKQTGWSIEGGIIYNDGFVSITGNAVNANTFFALSGSQYERGPSTSASVQQWNVQVEQTGGEPSRLFDLAAHTALTGCGGFALGGVSFGTIAGTLSVNGTACPIQNGNSYAVLTSAGKSDPVIGMNSSNQTTIKGDASEQLILIQPNPGATLVQASATTFGIQRDRALVLGEGIAPRQNSGNDYVYGDSTDHCVKLALNGGAYFCRTQTVGTGKIATAGTTVPGGTCQAETGITIAGAATTDNVIANIGATLPPTWQTGIQFSAHVTAPNTVKVYLCNATAGAITPAATQVNVRVLR